MHSVEIILASIFLLSGIFSQNVDCASYLAGGYKHAISLQ